MKKVKWYGVVFAVFVLLLYAAGVYDLCMMLDRNAAYYASKGYGEEVVRYFTDYPVYFLFFWIVNLTAGLLAPILYVLKKQQAAGVALLSASSDMMLIVLTCVFRNRIGVLGITVFIYDAVILLLTFFFYLLCRRQNTKSPTSTQKKQSYCNSATVHKKSKLEEIKDAADN